MTIVQRNGHLRAGDRGNRGCLAIIRRVNDFARGFVQEAKLEREFFREGTYHDIVILSIFKDETVRS